MNLDLRSLGIEVKPLTREFSKTLIAPQIIPEGQTAEIVCIAVNTALKDKGITFAFHGAAVYQEGNITRLHPSISFTNNADLNTCFDVLNELGCLPHPINQR